LSQILREFLETKFIPQPYIIGRGILPVRGKAIIAGPPKANKSFFILNLMLDIAKGRNIFGAEYKSGAPLMPVDKAWRVLYLEQEMGEQGLLERLRGKEDHPGLISEYSSEELAALDIHIKPRNTAMRLDTPDGRDYINSEIATVKPDVVFLDPMAKFHLSDENSSQDMGMVMRAADHLIEDHGCAIVLVHHVGKENIENPRRGGARLRGSSAIFGDIDTFIEIQRRSNEHHLEPVLEVTFELRRGEPIEPMFVQRLRDGSIKWMGEGFQFGQSQSHSASKREWPQGKYRSL
jgi:RecA-family ATPase